MSYSIMVDNITKKFWDGGWENRTWNTISNDDDSLRALYEDAGYDDDNDYNELDDEEKVVHIRESDAIHELSDSYYPLTNYVHVLQEKPTDEEILKIHKNAPNMVIIEDDLGNFFIGSSGGGMDSSEEIAYAYMVIDRCVPRSFRINEDSSYCLGKEAHKELIEFMHKIGGLK